MTIVLFLTDTIIICDCIGSSNIPYIKEHSLAIGLSSKFTKVNRYDFVIFEHDNKLLLKQVIGLNDESIEIIDSYIYVDGKRIKDPCSYFPHSRQSSLLNNIESINTYDGYYLLGCNRNVSYDSRVFGPISKHSKIWKVILVFNEDGPQELINKILFYLRE